MFGSPAGLAIKAFVAKYVTQSNWCYLPFSPLKTVEISDFWREARHRGSGAAMLLSRKGGGEFLQSCGAETSFGLRLALSRNGGTGVEVRPFQKPRAGGRNAAAVPKGPRAIPRLPNPNNGGS